MLQKGRTAERRKTKRQNGPNIADRGYYGCRLQWWSPKCCHFLYRLPNRKWLHFPASYWLIYAFFTGRGFLVMTNKMVRSKSLIQWLGPKACHFLFRSPNRKWQHFLASYWLIHAIFTGRGFLGMPNTMVKSKMLSLPISLAEQEVSAFSNLLLMDWHQA